MANRILTRGCATSSYSFTLTTNGPDELLLSCPRHGLVYEFATGTVSMSGVEQAIIRHQQTGGEPIEKPR